MKSKATIERELRKLEKFRKLAHRGGLYRQDEDLNYGAAQALGWVLGRNYAAASSCIVPILRKGKIDLDFLDRDCRGDRKEMERRINRLLSARGKK